jgi:hypothetical protein
MGAAGPFHLVALPVSDFGVFDKATGALLQSVPLDEFWANLVTDGPADFPFDTRVLFDQHSGRFVAVALDCTVNPNSWLMIAVSATDNALGTWNKWAIDADMDGTVQTLNWADFPGVGIDAHNLYVAANMFQGTTPRYQYSKVWVIPKAQLLAGQTPDLTWTEFPNPPGSRSTMQPAHIFGSSSAEYVVFEDWNPNATRLLLATIDNVTGTPVWHPPSAVAVDPYVQSFDLFLDLGKDAPQAGETRGIDTADTRLWNAVLRNGFLWATHHVGAGGKTEAAWYRIDPATSSVSAQGRISDPTRWYYFPSIAVNQDDAAAIGFSGSSSAEYAGGYYTILRPPYVEAEPVALLKSGEDTYFKVFGGGCEPLGRFERDDGGSNRQRHVLDHPGIRLGPRSGPRSLPLGALVGEIPPLRRDRALRTDRHGFAGAAGCPYLDGSIRQRNGFPDREKASAGRGLHRHRLRGTERHYLHGQHGHGPARGIPLFLSNTCIQCQRRLLYRRGVRHDGRAATPPIVRRRWLSGHHAVLRQIGRRLVGPVHAVPVPPRRRVWMETGSPSLIGQEGSECGSGRQRSFLRREYWPLSASLAPRFPGIRPIGSGWRTALET